MFSLDPSARRFVVVVNSFLFVNPPLHTYSLFFFVAFPVYCTAGIFFVSLAVLAGIALFRFKRGDRKHKGRNNEIEGKHPPRVLGAGARGRKRGRGSVQGTKKASVFQLLQELHILHILRGFFPLELLLLNLLLHHKASQYSSQKKKQKQNKHTPSPSSLSLCLLQGLCVGQNNACFNTAP